MAHATWGNCVPSQKGHGLYGVKGCSQEHHATQRQCPGQNSAAPALAFLLLLPFQDQWLRPATWASERGGTRMLVLISLCLEVRLKMGEIGDREDHSAELSVVITAPWIWHRRW